MAKILVVDDHAVQQRMYSYTLRKHGHTVLVAAHGEAALAVLEKTLVDLVITDFSMPEMDGLMLLKHMRTETRYQSLPVIVLINAGNEQDCQLADEAGANALLSKPTSSRELIETAHKLLGGRIIGGMV
ncbi:MAG: response regulator [Blastochloris sp.]|nr:response regulator [Blastochloris sp.]